MVNIILTNVTYGEAQGYILAGDLTKEQLASLGYWGIAEGFKVECLINFDLEFDDDIAMAQIETVSVWNGSQGVDLSADNDFDQTALESSIESWGYDFHLEYQIGRADYLRD